MIQARHGVRASALLFLLLFPACDLLSPDDSEGPGESEAMERMAELETNVSVMESGGLARLMEVRTEVRAATDLVLFPSAGDPLPDAYAGLVVARDPSTHEVEVLEGAEDALPNGVRVRAYNRHDTGELVVPLAQSGSFDFAEVEGVDPYLALTASDGEETLFELEDRSEPGRVVNLEGSLRGGIPLLLLAGTSGTEAPDLQFQLEISDGSSDWVVSARIEYFASSPEGQVSGFIELEATLESPEGTNELFLSSGLEGMTTDLQAEGFVSFGGPGSEGDGWYHEFEFAGSLDDLQFAAIGGEPAAPPGLPAAIASFLDTLFDPVATVLAGYEIPATLP